MFDFVHENKKLMQVILALLVLPFAFWGIDSYRKSGNGEALAVVEGEKIYQQEFDNALRQQQSRMREMMGDRFDAAIFDKPEIRRSILENLVNQRLLAIQARDTGLTAGDDQLMQLISGIEAFQKDGKFDKQRYEAVLRTQNMTPLLFEERVRQDVSVRQLTDAYAGNGYASHAVADNLVRLNEQQRVVSMSQLMADSYLRQVRVDDAAVKAYYEKNTGEFQTQEQARVEYVVLSSDALLSQVTVEDDEIKKYYEEHQSEFGAQEQRQAAHILIAVAEQAPEADRQAAKQKAEQVLQQVRQAPGKFSEFAGRFSQDPGSAASGGDLGLFGRGMMVKSFDEAVFALKPGEVSGLVQSEFGFHIIKLIKIEPAKVRGLAEVRNDIAQKLKQQKANDRFAELAERFNDVVYEQGDTLKPAAELASSPIRQSPWLDKGQADGAPWTEKALQAVFSREVLQEKRNSPAIEIAPNTLLAVRLLEHKPASTRPLAEVGESIRRKLEQQQALELATKQGTGMLEQLKRGETLKLVWKTGQVMTRAQAVGLGKEVVRQVFQADAAKLPAYIGVENPPGGYLLVRVDEIKDATAMDESRRARYEQELRRLGGEEMLRAYLADAKKHAEIEMQKLPESSKQ